MIFVCRINSDINRRKKEKNEIEVSQSTDWIHADATTTVAHVQHRQQIVWIYANKTDASRKIAHVYT